MLDECLSAMNKRTLTQVKHQCSRHVYAHSHAAFTTDYHTSWNDIISSMVNRPNKPFLCRLKRSDANLSNENSAWRALYSLISFMLQGGGQGHDQHTRRPPQVP